MKVTLSYDVPVTKTYEVANKKWKKFFEALVTDDDNKSVAQWEIVDNNCIADFIRAMGDEVDDYSDIDIDDFER